MPPHGDVRYYISGDGYCEFIHSVLKVVSGSILVKRNYNDWIQNEKLLTVGDEVWVDINAVLYLNGEVIVNIISGEIGNLYADGNAKTLIDGDDLSQM